MQQAIHIAKTQQGSIKPVCWTHIPDPEQTSGHRDHPDRQLTFEDKTSPYTEEQIVEIIRDQCWLLGVEALKTLHLHESERSRGA